MSVLSPLSQPPKSGSAAAASLWEQRVHNKAEGL